MDEIPLVSVIMPLYNKRPYVRRAIESIQQQTVANWELIVVDDGSTDGSAGEIPHSDERIHVFRQENKGPGAARNAGLARARGKYVSFLDADDEWLPSFLEAGLPLMEDRTANASVVFTGFYYYPSMRKYCVGSGEASSGVVDISTETDFKLVQRLCSYWTCAAIINTDVVRKWGGFFDRYRCLLGEDVFLFIKLAFNERIAVIPEPHVIYHTEASDLFGGGNLARCFPIPPYLEDPSELLAACPPVKLPVMKKVLAQKALAQAEALAKAGHGREAKKLLNRFNQDAYPAEKGALKIRILAGIAPLLPQVGRFWRKAKAIRCIAGVFREVFKEAK